jgi:thiol-disulfide isomerase/thioredoxin
MTVIFNTNFTDMVSFLLYSIFWSFTLQPGWHYNLDEAKAIAHKEHKHILLNFSGSDWCGPCIMLRKEILDDTVFLKMADTSLVLVNADFPRKKKDQLSSGQQSINNALADQYNAEGKFPLTLLLNAEGKVLKSWEGNPGVKPDVFAGEVAQLIVSDK